MAFIKAGFQVGDRIRLTNDVAVLAGVFTRGHELTVTGSTSRGLDLRDDDGNMLCETLMVEHLFEKVR